MKPLLTWLIGTRHHPGRRAPARKYRPRVEGLETRQLLSTFSVVLATDNGPTSQGQGVTQTSGDLRYCLGAAGHGTTADTVVFDPTLFATPQTITLNPQLGTLMLSPTQTLTITGPTGRTATVSGGDAIGILAISSGTVSISNLAISHGHTSGSNGGGISNSGTLTLTNCTLDHDVADAGGQGGGLFSNNPTGSTTLSGCTLNHDMAVHDPQVGGGNGGGIWDSGKLTLTNCHLSDDSASGVGGGGLWVTSNATVTSKDTLNGCLFSNDSTNEDGGAVFVVGTTLTVTFGNCILSNDSAGQGGGGLCTDGTPTVKMTRCTLSNDAAKIGGGVCSSNAGGGATVVLTQCTFSNDSAAPGSGGGGGFANQGQQATVTACTFSNDSAPFGGGMYNAGPATLTNCTFSNNLTTLNPSFGGGGIYNAGGFTIKLTYCTVANNSAGPGFGGGIWNAAGSTLNLTNTIVAENTASSGPDVSGAINTADHNLIGDGGGCTIGTDLGGNLVGGNGNPVIDPRLGPLQNNGGTTQTLALFADSPAIGHADDTVIPHTDQRSHARTDHFGLATDIGAYEYA
jgi:hypothetical protein